MARIEIEWSEKSIKEAIKQVKKYRKMFETEIPQTFINWCFDEIVTRANIYIASKGFDANITNGIKDGWDREVVGNYGKLINRNNKAVYIEFGVGAVGIESGGYDYEYGADPYGYDMKTSNSKKMKDGSWIFKIDDKVGIDIKSEYITSDREEHPNTIKTRGQPAQKFLFDAIHDMMSNGRFKKIWQEVLAEKL